MPLVVIEDAIITWPPFQSLQYMRNINNNTFNKRLLRRQKTGGACLHMPQDGHWLASFEVIHPPPKVIVFPRPNKQ